jgi:sulfotransferase
VIQKLHLISGLPRSGSTLLCALLRQNPRFRAAITSPVVSICSAVQQKMSGGGEFSMFFDDQKRAAMLRGVFDSYYPDTPDGHVVFDTNRIWTSKMPLITELYPDVRAICMVREIGWIIDSVERMLAKNPLQLSKLFNYQSGSTVYARVETLMNAEGFVGRAWSGLREAWFGPLAERLIVVSYQRLAGEPEQTLRRLYQELGEPYFHHNFENVEHAEPDYDAALGMPGLHAVGKRVEFRKQTPTIPPDLFTKYAHTEFWSNPERNVRGAKIL